MEVQSVLVHVSWTMSMFSRHFHGISMEKPGIHGKKRHVHGSSTAGGPGFYAEYIIVSIVNNLICTLAIVLEFEILLY